MKKQVAIIPSILDQKLFGTSIQFTNNYISLDAETNIGEFFGPIASRYSYTPELRSRLTDLVQAKRRGTSNNYFVLQGSVCLAAQSTLESALEYMNDSTVLVLCA